jgi:hypothetical protein
MEASVPVPIMEVSADVPSSEALLPHDVAKRPSDRARKDIFRSFMVWGCFEKGKKCLKR